MTPKEEIMCKILQTIVIIKLYRLKDAVGRQHQRKTSKNKKTFIEIKINIRIYEIENTRENDDASRLRKEHW